MLNFGASAVPYSVPGSITFNGGTLQYAAGNTADVSGGIAPIASGQAAIIDTSTNSVAFASSLSGSGGLTKAGAGNAHPERLEFVHWTYDGQRRHAQRGTRRGLAVQRRDRQTAAGSSA